MYKFKLILLFLLFISCNNRNDKVVHTNKFDIKAELLSIETTREKFMKAVKDNDGESIGKLVTNSVRTIGPGSAAWVDMYSNALNKGSFPYDSIIMFPKETIIVSDSIAYDFGNSNVYYTNQDGQAIELRNTFLAILKKGDDGVWRLHREVASSNFEN
ncbi:nuclear transport factor 2 family protein [Flavobacteriaceae bacterium SZ-1-7]|uniref:YybH family protein n=1 Tax=Tamlana sedimenti TaxID=3134126 RepID=UPI003128769B